MVLKTLDAMGPLHGYGIARRIEQVAHGTLALNQGTIYPALLRLEHKGWIGSAWGTSENNRRARFYAITRTGKTARPRDRELGAHRHDHVEDAGGQVMSGIRALLARLASVFARRRDEERLADEIAAHRPIDAAKVAPRRRACVPGRQAAMDPGELIPAIRAEVRKQDPQLAFTVEPVDAVVAATLTRQKLGTMLMLLFGTMALLLAAIGIYGMLAYAWTQRHGEVATRMALGATRANIVWLLCRHGLIVTTASAAIGLGIAYGAGRFAAGWLYEVRPSDPLILASALVLVLGVTLVATLIPAGRALMRFE
jgi:DNA-binding PadR family transcriptional regulator